MLPSPTNFVGLTDGVRLGYENFRRDFPVAESRALAHFWASPSVLIGADFPSEWDFLILRYSYILICSHPGRNGYSRVAKEIWGEHHEMEDERNQFFTPGWYIFILNTSIGHFAGMRNMAAERYKQQQKTGTPSVAENTQFKPLQNEALSHIFTTFTPVCSCIFVWYTT